MSENNYIRMEEVRKHTTSESVWFVINNVVYDVTKFMNEHPGGPEALLENAGIDSTVAFEDVGHSDDARSQMTKYRVGDLHPDDRIGKEKSPHRSSKSVRFDLPGEGGRSTLIKAATSIIILGVVIGIILKKRKII